MNIPHARMEYFKKHFGDFAYRCISEAQPDSFPPMIWHYTTAEALIEILKSGQLWLTQISCLNDSLEKKYFVETLRKYAEQSTSITDPGLIEVYNQIRANLASPDFTADGTFVGCFSRREDDLGQWRGYGSGECGYSIGFNAPKLRIAMRHRNNAFLIEMKYQEKEHQDLSKRIFDEGEAIYLRGRDPARSNISEEAAAFLDATTDPIDFIASMVKHPKFKAEDEWRIVTRLKEGEHKFLEFKQRRTLLARHLPLKLTLEPESLLPIEAVYVGPGPAQAASRISVGDLLAKYDYQGVHVIPSSVPYRVP